MSEEKKLILRMLKEGKITEDEAMTLLDSIKENNKQNKADFSQFGNFSQFESNLIDKISQAATKITKKSQEMINSFDFEDINIKFNSNFEQKSRIDRVVSEKFDEDKEKVLEVYNKNGKVSISPWENDEIEARADVYYDDRLVSKDYNFLTIEKEEGKIVIEPNYESASPRYFDLNTKVFVPNTIMDRLIVETKNGSIELENLEVKNLEVNTINSKIKLNNLKSENSLISTTNARISIDGIEGERLDVDTTNGKIELNNVGVKLIDLGSTNGTILIANVKDLVEKIFATTSNGNIMISLKDLFKPVKAIVENNFKLVDTSNFSETKFTNFVNEGDTMIAYSDGYDENGDKLDIEASTNNGAINIK